MSIRAHIVTLLLGLTLGAAGSLGGCGPPPDEHCDGAGRCLCEDESICDIACPGDGCDIDCASNDGCAATCDHGCSFDCQDSPDCDVDCLDDCVIDCRSISSCRASCGARCDYHCESASSCEVTVGPESSVTCLSFGSCAVDCLGACTVDCGGGGCEVRCAAGVTPEDIEGGKRCPPGP